MDPDNLNMENPGSGHAYSDGTPCSGMPYNAFHQYLVTTYNQLRQRGHWVTMDTNQMNIFVYQFPVQGIEDNKSQGIKSPLRLEVSENPFSTQTLIRVLGEMNDRSEIQIFDTKGVLVKKLPLQKALNSYSVIWDGTDRNKHKLPNGIYLASLEYKNTKIEKKIVFQR
jgi:hypothetical protein